MPQSILQIYADSGMYNQKIAHKTASATMESMAEDHCHSSFLSYVLVAIMMPVSLNLDNISHWKTSKSNKMFGWNIDQGKTDEMFCKANTRKVYIDYKM